MKPNVFKTIRGANHFIANKSSPVSIEFESILTAINGIGETELISRYIEDIKNHPSHKSLSDVLNQMVKENLKNEGWTAESFIFKDKDYKIRGKEGKPSAWQLDHVKEKISLEVSFNHSQNVAINLIRPTLASEQNHVEKEVNTEMAVIVCMSDNLKIAGNFDSAVASTTDWLRYLKPYSQILTAPLAFIEIGAPSTFFIPQGSTVESSSPKYPVNKVAQIGDEVLLGKTQPGRKPKEKWIKESKKVVIQDYSVVNGEFKIEVADINGKESSYFEGKKNKYTPSYFASM